MIRLDGKVAVVTGANRGVGEAMFCNYSKQIKPKINGKCYID